MRKLYKRDKSALLYRECWVDGETTLRSIPDRGLL